jgi:hypothetical protein
MASPTSTAEEVTQLFARLEVLTAKDKRVGPAVAKLKSLVLTLKRLPIERQRQEFNHTVFQALNCVSFYRDYHAKDAWRETLFPCFIQQWGNMPLSEFPLNRWRHEGVISWLRNELDKLRLEDAKQTLVKLQIEPHDSATAENTRELEVHLSDTVGDVAARVAALVNVPDVVLYFDYKALLDRGKALIEFNVVPHAPLKWRPA